MVYLMALPAAQHTHVVQSTKQTQQILLHIYIPKATCFDFYKIIIKPFFKEQIQHIMVYNAILGSQMLAICITVVTIVYIYIYIYIYTKP
jgi:hypothetical protein